MNDETTSTPIIHRGYSSAFSSLLSITHIIIEMMSNQTPRPTNEEALLLLLMMKRTNGCRHTTYFAAISSFLSVMDGSARYLASFSICPFISIGTRIQSTPASSTTTTCLLLFLSLSLSSKPNIFCNASQTERERLLISTAPVQFNTLRGSFCARLFSLLPDQTIPFISLFFSDGSFIIYSSSSTLSYPYPYYLFYLELFHPDCAGCLNWNVEYGLTHIERSRGGVSLRLRSHRHTHTDWDIDNRSYIYIYALEQSSSAFLFPLKSEQWVECISMGSI